MPNIARMTNDIPTKAVVRAGCEVRNGTASTGDWPWSVTVH